MCINLSRFTLYESSKYRFLISSGCLSCIIYSYSSNDIAGERTGVAALDDRIQLDPRTFSPAFSTTDPRCSVKRRQPFPPPCVIGFCVVAPKCFSRTIRYLHSKSSTTQSSRIDICNNGFLFVDRVGFLTKRRSPSPAPALGPLPESKYRSMLSARRALISAASHHYALDC